jgi:hypothetical protein
MHCRFVKAARERIKVLLSESNLNLSNNNQLPKILLSLAQHDDEELIQSSLQLLDKSHTLEATLFASATQAMLLITRKSVALYNIIEERLLSDLQDCLNWKNIMAGDGHPGNGPLLELSRWCWLEGEVEGCEPHQENQKIIYNFGTLVLCIAKSYQL